MEISKYLIDKIEEIKEINVIKRKITPILCNDFITCLIGPRRAGKTYLMYHILKTNPYVLYVNFEEITTNIINLPLIYYQTFGKLPEIILLDEVQNVENWEKQLYRLYETKKYKIIISGSNSKLLSKEIATQLRGRSISQIVFPLSFSEYLEFKQFKLEIPLSSYTESKIKYLLREYLFYGSFPQIALNKSLYALFFDSYIDVVLYRDIIERYKIRNAKILKIFSKLLINSMSKQFSVRKIYNLLKSEGYEVGLNTLYEYLDMLETIFFIFAVKKYSKKLKESELSIPKIYLIDSAIHKYYLNSNRLDIFIENTVFLHLRRKYNSVFYYKTKNNKEIDFIIKDKTINLIEVTYELDQEHVNKVFKALNELNLKEGLIITWDDEDEIRRNDKIIKVIPLWKWITSPI
jgi:predicted AAA+ superfamily ATPase